MASPNQKASTGSGTFRRSAAFIITVIGVLLIVIAFVLSRLPTSTVVSPTLTDPLRHEVARRIAELEHGDWHGKGEAARALGKLGDIRAVEPLVAALEDEDYGVAMAAAEALGALGDSRAVEPLIAALEDEDYWAAMAAGPIVR